MALALLTAAPLGAQVLPAQPTPVRFRVNWTDGAITGVAAIGAWLPSVLGDRLPVASCGACDPSHLWGIDRGTVGPTRSGPGAASDVALLATVLGSTALFATAHRGESGATSAALEDGAVFAQALAVDGLITQWLKVAFHRPRPERYTPQGAQFAAEVEDSRSFPSGHASFAFAASAAAASILHRHGTLHDRRLATVLLFSGATITSVLRVVAHKHFPTDVFAGAVLGTAVGWAVPQLHPVRP